MTNKEFFIETVAAEQPVFIKVIKALPQDKLDYKVHEKSRKAGGLAFQLASQPGFISMITKLGQPDWGNYKEPQDMKIDQVAALAEKNFEQLKKDLVAMPDSDWETGTATMVFPGGKWEAKKFTMAWGFFFDLIHHRGQLTTFLRAMGEKVPSVYGGSADERPSA